MNLYLRLIRILLRQFWAKGLDNPLNRRFIFFRVWPHDCDFNLHLTNSRYLAFMDLCRMDLMMGLGMTRNIMKNKWKFVVNAQEITYIKEMPPLSRFRISSQILGWDEKYFYLEQRFIADGKIHAYGLVKAIFLQQGKKTAPDQVASTLGISLASDPLPEHMILWKSLSIAKRSYSLGA